MKNFIKIALTALAFLVGSNMNAQLLPVSFGVKGGINSSTIEGKEFKSRYGFNVGLNLDVNFTENIAIMTGVEISSKSAIHKGIGSIDIANQVYTTDSRINAIYLQLPLHAGYKINVMPGLKLHVEAGPYFAQGLGGMTDFRTRTIDGGDRRMKTFKDDVLSRFDWGVGVAAGITVLNRIQMRAGYDMGLRDLAKVDNLKVRQRNFYASLGFLFF